MKLSSSTPLQPSPLRPGETKLSRSWWEWKNDFKQASHLGNGQAGLGQKTPHLSILDLTGRSRILALDSNGFLSLLDKSCFIQDSNGLGICKLFDHEILDPVPGSIGVPVHLIEQSLRPIRTLVSHHFGQLPPVLSLNRGQESPKIFSPLLTGLNPRKQIGESGMKRSERFLPLIKVLQRYRSPANMTFLMEFYPKRCSMAKLRL